ncbi:hypothetical protein ACFXPW_05170 [Streptomyces goshikiensis]|uniref:hypothetical protein n=1 Tax=Streptomyces goshikiensis TaxID=1942 RepID=UPI0036AE3B28
MTLYHKGGEEQVEAAVAPQRAKGIRVELRSAPYNRSELREAAARLMGRSLTIDGQLTSVHSAGARSDGSGLVVEGEPLRANDTNSGNGQARTADPAVPWTGTVTGAPAPLESREHDAPLHSGGMLLRQRYKGGPICTSGFVVTWPQRGLDYLMTAAHCGGFLHNYTIWSGQPIYRQSQQLLNVNRAAHSFVGEYLCASGSLSGEVCKLKVAEGKHFTRYKEFSTGTEVYTLKNTGGGFTAMKGDSGGPVFSRNVDGSVVARGLISAGVVGAKTETCSNPAANNSPVECYRHIYVTDVPDVLNQHLGMRIAN